MTLYKQILDFGDTFNSIRMHENFVVVDLKLPINWEIKKVISSRGNKIQIKPGNNNETHKLVSFFSVFTPEDCDILIEEIKAVIKWNKDVEEKNSLLDLKMLELKKEFAENPVDALRKLNFDFNQKIDLNGQEQYREVVPSGSIEGPEGNPTT